MINIQINVPYAGIKISTAWGYLSLVLGCGIFILRALVYMIQDIKDMFNNEIIT